MTARGLSISLGALAAAASLAAPAAAVTPPRMLPGDVSASTNAKRSTWLIGARPTQASRDLAARYGARVASSELGTLVAPRKRARALAAALAARGLLVSAEPDVRFARAESPSDPLMSQPTAWWRPAIVAAQLTPPPVSAGSPMLAVIDTQADPTHPEFQGSALRVGPRRGPVTDEHGTAVASVAAAPSNGVGIVGIWPGMNAVAYATDLSCGDIVRQIDLALRAGADVINMSFGSDQLCFALYQQIQRAVGAGAIPVAAAGNEFQEGNPAEFPASLPHVMTISAVDPQLQSSFFSNANAAIDVAAPGENVLAAAPVAFDPGSPQRGDAPGDGYAVVDGTSFAAPMAAAAIAWVRAARPTLSPDQVAQVVRLSATDLPPEGFDPNNGFGLVNLAAALTAPPPPRDILEPNDDIVWIDGRAFGEPDRPIYSGRTASGTVRGLLDRQEDPADVYRVRVPARGRIRFTTTPAYGDPDLEVFRSSARTIEANRGLIDRSNRSRGTDRVEVVNAGRRSIIVYVSIYIDPRASQLDAGYTLKAQRRRFR